MHTVTTVAFTSTPTAYVRRVAVMILGRWWWLFLLPVVAFGIASIREAAWIFVALMLVFLLYPAIVAFVYINYALSPEGRRTLVPHCVTLSDRGVTVSYSDGTTQTHSRSQIKSIEYLRRSVLIRFRSPSYAHIDIPMTAVSENDLPVFHQILEHYSDNLA